MVWLLALVLAGCGGRDPAQGDDEDVYVETTLEECGVDETLLAMLACGQTEPDMEGCLGVGDACDRYLNGHVQDADCLLTIPGYLDGALDPAVAACEALAPVAVEVMRCEGATVLWPADPEAYDCPCELPLPPTDEDMDVYNRCVQTH